MIGSEGVFEIINKNTLVYKHTLMLFVDWTIICFAKNQVTNSAFCYMFVKKRGWVGRSVKLSLQPPSHSYLSHLVNIGLMNFPWTDSKVHLLVTVYISVETYNILCHLWCH